MKWEYKTTPGSDHELCTIYEDKIEGDGKAVARHVSAENADEICRAHQSITPSNNDFLREEIAKYEFGNIPDRGFPLHKGFPFEDLPDDWWSKVLAYVRADNILGFVSKEKQYADNYEEVHS